MRAKSMMPANPKVRWDWPGNPTITYGNVSMRNSDGEVEQKRVIVSAFDLEGHEFSGEGAPIIEGWTEHGQSGDS